MKHQPKHSPRPRTPRSANRRRSREQTEFIRTKIQNANEACQSGEFKAAVELFTEIIAMEPNNSILYCNRSAAYVRMSEYKLALNDALKTIELDPEWHKGHYRQAIALQYMGRYPEALASYASALAHDEKSQQLLQALVEAALKSHIQATLEPLFEQLDKLEITGKPFATVALIGQELLSANEIQPAITVLESSLHLGTDDLTLKGSVYSALSSAYWKVGNVKRALHYMHQDLLIVEGQNDNAGTCRVHGNLGSTYYSQNQYTEALHHHQMQLEVASKMKDRAAAAQALTSLGHVYVSMGEYENALASHKRCALLRQQINDNLSESRELENVGTVYALMGDFENATQCQEESLRVARTLKNPVEVCRAMATLGSLYQNNRKYENAVKIFQEMLKIAQEIADAHIQCRALSGLGNAFRMQNNIAAAERCHEQQLKIAIDIKDRTMESRAQCNLGVTYQHKGEYEKALEFHKAHLSSCRKLADKEGESRAYGNIGNAYQSLGQFERAIKYHKLGLSAVRDLKDQLSEATLHGNLAVAFQSLKMNDESLEHYKEHLTIAKDVNDLRSECIAESNLGNFFSTSNKFEDAVHHFENYLSVAEKLQDKQEMCKASHNLAYAYYQLQNYNDSIEYYEQNISLAYDLDDRELLQMAYCNLGLAYLAMNDYEKAVRCQKLFLASAREKKNILSVCKALGNLGTIYIKMGDTEEGLNFFYKQVRSADKSNLSYLQADCYHQLAKVLEDDQKYDEAIIKYERELSYRRQLKKEIVPFCNALKSYSNMLEKLGRFNDAYRLYCEMFQVTKKHANVELCRETCYLMGQVNMKMGKYEKAISAFRLQLECVNDFIEDSIDAGRVHVFISDCYLYLEDIENAIQHLLQYQEIATKLMHHKDENESLKKLSQIHSDNGDYQDALMFSEKRLICTQELTNCDMCEAYRDVATYHSLLENYDTAISYYEQLLKIARNACLVGMEYEAYKGLGTTYSKIKDFEKALHSFSNAAEKANALEDLHRRAESFLKVGDAQQLTGNKEEALEYFLKALETSEELQSKLLKVQTCGRIGKLHHLLANPEEATSYLRIAATCSEELEDTDEKIKAFCRLGLRLYFEKQFEESEKYFEKVITLIEESDEVKLSIMKEDILQFVLASYQMLQKVLILLKKPLEALFVAEKANSINLELLLKRTGVKAHVRIPLYEKFLQRIDNLGTTACFYSIAVGQLYCWLLRPGKGCVKFWKQRIIEKYTDNNLPSLDLDDLVLHSFHDACETLNGYVAGLRKSLDVQDHAQRLSDRTQSFASNIEIIDRRQHRKSRIGRPVVMSSLMDTSLNYQFRYKAPEKTYYEHKPNKNYNWHLEAPVEEIYKLLVSQTDAYFDELREGGELIENTVDLTLVIPRELSLVPFMLLKGENYEKYFCERYDLSHSPTLFWLLDNRFDRVNVENMEIDDNENIFVFGGHDDHSTEEATSVARIFGSSATLGSSGHTIREEIMARMSRSTICHLSTDVAWQKPSLVFPYKDITQDFARSEFSDPDIEDLCPDDRVGSPGLNDIFMSVRDISEINFNANLLTFGIAPSGGYSDPICADGLHLLVTSLLMTGCKTILTSLWPIPTNARRYFLQNFYQFYNRGIPAYEACSKAIQLMRNSEDFHHPSNWAGFIIYGQNSKLYRKTQSFTNALHEFLEKPNRDAIKVILHLIEKARQRLSQDRRSSLYVAESSITKKIQNPEVAWRPMLIALGFRFEKAHNSLPDSVFFPGHEYGEALNSSSNTLYAFLGLSRNGLDAIAKLKSAKNLGGQLVSMFQQVLYYFNQDMSNVQVPFQLPLWRTPGCHEFLSSLGFDVMGVGKTEVMLRSGKTTMRRPIQCALQAVQDLFELDEEDNENHMLASVSKAYSEMYIKSSQGTLGKKTKSETNLHAINGKSSLQRTKSNEILEQKNRFNRSTNDLTRNSIKSDSGNSYLNSDLGLFSSKESNNINENSGGAVRRLRAKTQELIDYGGTPKKKLSIYGLKTDMKLDMKRYGTMEKLDVSDLVMKEDDSDDSDDEWRQPISFYPENLDGMRSPDIFDDEDIEHFSKYFKNGSFSAKRRRSLTRSFSNASRSSATDSLKSNRSNEKLRHVLSDASDASSFAHNYLTQNKEQLQREHSTSSEESKPSTPRRSRAGSEDDMFKDESTKQKMPPEWRRLHLNTGYFDANTPIKTTTIRESLSIDSGVSSADSGRHTRQTSGGLQDFEILSTGSPKGSPEQTRNGKALESSDESDQTKKKGWFKIFNKKKRHSIGNLLDTEQLDSLSVEKHDSKKRYSDSPLLLSPKQNNDRKKNHRKSEGDINYNLKHSVTPPDYGNHLTPKGVEMSLC